MLVPPDDCPIRHTRDGSPPKALMFSWPDPGITHPWSVPGIGRRGDIVSAHACMPHPVNRCGALTIS
jgi:hypothetical protein